MQHRPATNTKEKKPMALHRLTPLVESDGFGTPAQRVWLKMECLQPGGSFKTRGIGHAAETHAARGARRLLSSSGGNAGIAVAYCGRQLGLPVLVVVPETTSERAKALMRRLGAEVSVRGRSWHEANQHLATLRGPGDAFIHPFDDPLVWQGHATLIAEAATQGPRPGAVVLSVGGGGLMCGVLQGMHAAGWHDVPLVAVETRGAESLPAITSLATTLGARQVCDAAFNWTRSHEVHSLTVSDDEAVRACLAVADEHRLIVEPACGAAIAATLQRQAAPLRTAADVLVVLCGGLSTTYEDLLAMAGPRLH
jgi:L-serine/L-threonine ammonia-lyase